MSIVNQTEMYEDYIKAGMHPDAARVKLSYEVCKNNPVPAPAVCHQLANILNWMAEEKLESGELRVAAAYYNSETRSFNKRPSKAARKRVEKRLKLVEAECYKALDLLASQPDKEESVLTGSLGTPKAESPKEKAPTASEIAAAKAWAARVVAAKAREIEAAKAWAARVAAGRREERAKVELVRKERLKSLMEAVKAEAPTPNLDSVQISGQHPCKEREKAKTPKSKVSASGIVGGIASVPNVTIAIG